MPKGSKARRTVDIVLVLRETEIDALRFLASGGLFADMLPGEIAAYLLRRGLDDLARAGVLPWAARTPDRQK